MGWLVAAGLPILLLAAILLPVSVLACQSDFDRWWSCAAWNPCCSGNCEAWSHACRRQGEVGAWGSGGTKSALKQWVTCASLHNCLHRYRFTWPFTNNIACTTLALSLCTPAGDPCHLTRPCRDGLSCQPGVHKCYHYPREYDEPCVAGHPCAEGLSCAPGRDSCWC